MIRHNDVRVFHFSNTELEQAHVFLNAKKAVLNGRSAVRQANRKELCLLDQIVGQVGNYAASIWLDGNGDTYRRARRIANANPYSGDDGDDLPPYGIDVKTSLMRRQQNPLAYHLLVRPNERHFGIVYILALAVEKKNGWSVILVGCCYEEELPAFPEFENPAFKGAYAVPAKYLSPLPRLR